MADVTAQANAAWNLGTTWSTGQVPTAGQTVDLLARIVTVPSTVDTITCKSITASTTGHLNITDPGGDTHIYADIIGGPSSASNSLITFNVSGSSTRTLTITGNVTGGNGVPPFGAILYTCTTTTTSTCLTINGNVYGGGGSTTTAGTGILLPTAETNATITINGSVHANSSYGIVATDSQDTTSITINGDLTTSGSGDVVASTTAAAINMGNGSTTKSPNSQFCIVTINNGNLIGSSTRPPIYVAPGAFVSITFNPNQNPTGGQWPPPDPLLPINYISINGNKYPPQLDGSLILYDPTGVRIGRVVMPNNGSYPYTPDPSFVLRGGYFGNIDALTQGTYNKNRAI